jgi:hypothetical protein
MDGVIRFNPTEKIFVPVEFEFWVQTSLHQNQLTAKIECFLYFSSEFFAFHNVSIRIPTVAVKSTEIAVNITPIGIVDISVNNVSDIAFGVFPLPDDIRSLSQGKQIVALEKR